MTKELTLADLNPNLQTSKQMSKRYVWMDTQELFELAMEYVNSNGGEVELQVID